jgi:hypothetical protein
LISGFDLAS